MIHRCWVLIIFSTFCQEVQSYRRLESTSSNRVKYASLHKHRSRRHDKPSQKGASRRRNKKCQIEYEWIIILGTGRSGTTSALEMMNALPSVSLTGEHYGFLKELESIEHKLEHTNHMFGPAWRHTPYNKDRFYCWVRSWFLEEESQANVLGFKEIRYNNENTLNFIFRVFPNAKFIITYRKDLAAQLKSRQRAPGFSSKGSISSLKSETQALLDFHAQHPNSTYLLPLESFSADTFSSVFHWLGFSHCNAIALTHANRNGGYRDDKKHHRIVHCSSTPKKIMNSTITTFLLSLRTTKRKMLLSTKQLR